MSVIVDSPERRLTDYLVAHGHLLPDEAEVLLADPTERGLAERLADDGRVAQDVLAGAVAALCGLRCVPSSRLWAKPEALQLVGPALARDVRGLPLAMDDSRVVVAFSMPPSDTDLARLRAAVGRDVVAVIAEVDALRDALDLACGPANHTVASLPAPPPPPPPAAPVGAPIAPSAPVATATAAAAAAAAAVAAVAASVEAAGPGSTVTVTVDSPSSRAGFTIDELLLCMLELNGSDLHLTAGARPTVRVHGALQQLEQYEPLDSDTIKDLVYGVLTPKQVKVFEDEMELDLAYSIESHSRFRMNVFRQRGSVGTVLRTIPFQIPSFDSLGLPPVVKTFADLPRGLVLVTGPTGSGKSTTLASLLDIVNRSKPVHIISCEDPIEFVHNHQRAIVNQREVGQDTPSFASALKRALREDPDVILVGEMRDLETIHMALTAAETGHLVFGTLHTQSAPQTVDRMVDVFPPEQQGQIRVMLATTLQAIVTQQLVPLAHGAGRCVASEVLVVTPAVRNLIREAKGFQIATHMQAGAQHGMVTMDQNLAALVKAGRISLDTALERAMNPEDLRHLLGRR